MEITRFHLLFFCCGFMLCLRIDGRPGPAGPVSAVFSLPGEDIVLPCRPASPLSPSPDLVLEWSRVDGPSQVTLLVLRGEVELVKEKDHQYIGRTVPTDGYSLKLLVVQLQDNSTYSCVIRRGLSVQYQVSVSLIVAQVSEVTISTSKVSSNELLVLCESHGWYPPPQVSLLDSNRKDLHAHTERSIGPDSLVSFKATLSLGTDKATLTGNGSVTCRVEIPEMYLVRERQIDVGESFSPQEAGSDLTIISISCVFLLLFIIACVIVYWNKRLSAMLQRWREVISRKLTQGTGSGAAEGFEEHKGASVKVNVMAGDETSEEESEAREDVPLLRNIMKVETKGAFQTAKVNRLSITGVKASHELAKRDLTEMMKYRKEILSVGKSRGVHPALIAAIISRQSQAGTILNPRGFGKHDTNCFGLMQIHKSYHDVDERKGPFSREHLDQGAAYLCELINTMRKNTDWTAEQHLKGAVACYIAGPDNVIGLNYEEVDSRTPNVDFANDVIARAQWYADNGFKMS